MVVVVLAAAVLAPALVRLWCVKGLVQTIRIDGPSMAETLCGNHFRVTCGDCGFPFRCDAEHFPDDHRAVCPNCGFRENVLRSEDSRRGDTVLVDAWPYLWSVPQRGDMVMLREHLEGESSGKSFLVKRVAALPRESPGIQGGNLLADGNVVRKSIREVNECSVLVHDNDFLPRSMPGKQRWLPLTSKTKGWTAIPGGFHFESVAGHEEEQWLGYQHWHGSASPAHRTEASAVQDNDSYNQGDNRGLHGLNAVHDLVIRCNVKGDNGDIMLVLQDEGHKFRVHFQLDSRTFLVLHNNSTILTGRLPEPARRFTLEAAICDGNFLVAYNQLALTSIPYDKMPAPQSPSPDAESQPRLQIGAYGGPLDITHIQVWRDIYHLGPTGLASDWQAKTALAQDEYFVLGDNAPVSVDSRQWPPGSVPRASILGKVIGRTEGR